MSRALASAVFAIASLAAGAVLAQAYPSSPTDRYAAAPAGLLTAEATHDAVARWLADNVPSSRGKTVYVSGPQAFWYEHQDRDPKRPMHVTATIHSENFADADSQARSTYEVTDFDCEKQTEYRIYLRRYMGPDLSGDVRKEGELLKLSRFVSPTDEDYAHLRTVCLPVYDELRKRTYEMVVPVR